MQTGTARCQRTPPRLTFPSYWTSHLISALQTLPCMWRDGLRFHHGGVHHRPGATRTSAVPQGLPGAFPGHCSLQGRRTCWGTRCRRLEDSVDGFWSDQVQAVRDSRGPSLAPWSRLPFLLCPTQCHRGRIEEGTRAAHPSQAVWLFPGHISPHQLDAGKKSQPSPERKGSNLVESPDVERSQRGVQIPHFGTR